ncbi:MAG: asparagine synthase (glutamine-hydrolyzing) [Chitinophagaceae bacterium]
MCGISAIINKTNINSCEEIKVMTEKVRHRGPDSNGYYADKNVLFGFRRLAILDLSADGNQPMYYQDNLVIVFNGEIFNYIELKDELQKHGYHFKTQTDTEVILAGYDYWGEDCVKHFNGMWAFALHDKRKNKVFCSRDRYGIKPLAYHINDKQIIIASEVKQILTVPSYKPSLNINSAIDFLEFNRINQNEETFFTDIYYLPPGFMLTIDLVTFKLIKTQYFNLGDIQINTAITYDEAVEAVREKFYNAIKIRLRTDVNIGTFLSGGVDSTSVICTAKTIKTDYLSATSYSSCYEDKSYDEQEYIDTVIDYLHLKSKKIFPDLDEMLTKGTLNKMCYHHDQPVIGASFFNEFKLFELAGHDHLKVILDGQGADEFLAGYLNFPVFNINHLLRFKPVNFVKELYYQKQNHNKSYYRSLSNIFYHAANLLKKPGKYNPGANGTYSSKIINNRYTNYRELSLDEVKFTSIPHQLHAQDRSSMAHSVESRNPFLDFELTEFVYSLPDEFKMKNGTSKRVLRDAMRGIIPDKIINRHSKLGFVAPEPMFMLRNKEKVKQLLKETVDNNPELINKNIIQQFESFNDHKNYDHKYFRLISFLTFQKEFNLFN